MNTFTMKDMIFATIIIAGIVLLIFTISEPTSDSQSVVLPILGKSDTEVTLNNYIEARRDKQIIEQRHETIQLYINTLDQGTQNRGKVQSPSEAPEVCEIAQREAGSGSDVDKAENMASYLMDEVEYDWGNVMIDSTGKPRIRSKKTPSEVIVAKKALCGELTNTFMLMGECVDIPIFFIHGGGHAWNVVVSGDKIVEVDNTQDCFDCDTLKEEHNYPVIGLCSREKCININQVVELAKESSIFKQTLG